MAIILRRHPQSAISHLYRRLVEAQKAVVYSEERATEEPARQFVVEKILLRTLKGN